LRKSFDSERFFLWTKLSIMVENIMILCHFTCWLGAYVRGVFDLNT
jgi:hypothetical protein